MKKLKKTEGTHRKNRSPLAIYSIFCCFLSFLENFFSDFFPNLLDRVDAL